MDYTHLSYMHNISVINYLVCTYPYLLIRTQRRIATTDAKCNSYYAEMFTVSKTYNYI